MRVALGKSHRVFSLAAPQFEYDGTVVAEEVAVPMPFQGVIPAESLLEGRLYEAGKGEVFAESSEFVFAHGYRLFSIWRPTDSMPRTGRVGVNVMR